MQASGIPAATRMTMPAVMNAHTGSAAVGDSGLNVGVGVW
jgi:hypothetical protein